MDNQTWIIEKGHLVIEKMVRLGSDGLTDWEHLVYSLWVTDYGMCNAGDLDTATDVYENWKSVGMQAAERLGLPVTCSAFSMSTDELQVRYFELFDEMCDEIRKAEPASTKM